LSARRCQRWPFVTFGWADRIRILPSNSIAPQITVKSSADRPDTAKPGQPSASSADAIAAPIGSVHGTSKRGVQHIEPSLIKQAAKAPQRTAVARTDLSKLQQ
jgi:hypothetical protein